jgi:bacterial/archaeal transporter family protein
MQTYQIFALISMLFAGFTSIIAKAGLKNVASDTGLAVRTSFVFLFIWLNIYIFNDVKDFCNLSKKDILFLAISAITTTLSWVFYYKAIKIGNVSEVALIDKASILITLLLAFTLLGEALTLKTFIGASLILGGLVVLAWK